MEPIDAISDKNDREVVPNALKKNTAAPKTKPRVQFILPDDSDAELYCGSEDGTAQYSGSDDDVPIARSPHRLRSTESSRKAKKPKGNLL